MGGELQKDSIKQLRKGFENAKLCQKAQLSQGKIDI